MSNLENLRALLSSMPAGKHEGNQAIEGALARAWDEVGGQGAACGEFGEIHGGIYDGSKIIGRTEKLAWNPPNLSFAIERHGEFCARASKWAELQFWVINVDKCRASLSCKKRLMAPRVRQTKTAKPVEQS